MELKFVAAKKPEAVNTTVLRRQRLVRRIDQQVSLISAAKDGMLPRTSWVWMDDKGSYFLPIKYGRNPIELKKGMFAIECDDIDHAADNLLDDGSRSSTAFRPYLPREAVKYLT